MGPHCPKVPTVPWCSLLLARAVGDGTVISPGRELGWWKGGTSLFTYCALTHTFMCIYYTFKSFLKRRDCLKIK